MFRGCVSPAGHAGRQRARPSHERASTAARSRVLLLMFLPEAFVSVSQRNKHSGAEPPGALTHVGPVHRGRGSPVLRGDV